MALLAVCLAPPVAPANPAGIRGHGISASLLTPSIKTTTVISSKTMKGRCRKAKIF